MIPSAIFSTAGVLLLVGSLSNKLQSRWNMPVLLLFLIVGCIAEYCLPFQGDQYVEPINFFALVAMSFILFSGGLETPFRSVRSVLLPGVLLASVGVLLTAFFQGTGAYLIFGRQHGFCWCLLLAALISSTDAAAVFSILRGKGVGLKGELQPLLELESGSNDPMAAFLTVFMISAVRQTDSLHGYDVLRLLYGMCGGVAAGMLLGFLGRQIYKIKQEYEGLYFVICVALVLLSYGLAESICVNGFMAAYSCGVTMGSRAFYYKKAITKFSNGMAWLMQVGLFTVLGFLAKPREIFQPEILLRGILLSLFLMFIARPAAVFLCLCRSRFSTKEKLLISWVGLRGAAPITLATFPLAANVPDAGLMFNLIFCMVSISIIFQGITLMPLARLLQLDHQKNEREPIPLELEMTSGSSKQDMLEFEVLPDAFFVGKTLAEMGLPPGALVTMIRRKKNFLSPRGDTVIQAGDGMLIMADKKVLEEIIREFFPESGQEIEPF